MSKQSINSSPKKGSHFTLEDRAKIEYGLKRGHSIRSIAKDLEKSPSSVLREIERNCTHLKSNGNSCSKINTCNVRHACGDMGCNILCRKRCPDTCFEKCSEFEMLICEKLKKAPHVCNSCSSFKSNSFMPCRLDRKVYYAHEADNKYREMLVSRRDGFDMTLGELVDLDNTITPLLRKGQSPYHIVQTNELPVSLSTVYRIVHSGQITAGKTDLKQSLRRKP